MAAEKKTWDFTYYGWFGAGDSSDDIDYEAEVSDEEYEFLEMIRKYNDDYDELQEELTVNMSEDERDEFDLDEFINKYLEEHKDMMNELQDRIESEISEDEKENYDDDEEFEDVEFCVRWPWDE